MIVTVVPSSVMVLSLNTVDPVAFGIVFGLVVIPAVVTIPAPASVLEPVPPFAVGNMPDTSAVKSTADHVGAPPVFPCRTVFDAPAAVALSVDDDPW